jgi:hypothetical protein
VEQYRTYLRAELGKLRNEGDAQAFLRCSDCRVDKFGLVAAPRELAQAFASQDDVDGFVASLGAQTLVALTSCCGRWRRNGIEAKLSPRQLPRVLDVFAERVLLMQAEPDLGPLFEENGYRLTSIARDPRVLAAAPYRDHVPGERVAFPRCLANPVASSVGTFRIFDGMHRAIQLVRNGATHIEGCVVEDP